MAKRRANGEGCIYQRKDGRWIAEITRKGKRQLFSGKTQMEVKEKLKAAIRDQAIQHHEAATLECPYRMLNGMCSRS